MAFRRNEIFVGSWVIVTSNREISKGLISGAMDTITEVIWPYFRRVQVYNTDIPSVRKNLVEMVYIRLTQ